MTRVAIPARRRARRAHDGRSARSRLGAAALALGCCAGLPACEAPSYGNDRWNDLGDTIDLRSGRGHGFGLSLQATMYFEPGLGLSWMDTWHDGFGRRRVSGTDGGFAQALVFGITGRSDDPSAATSSRDLLGCNLNLFGSPDEPPLLDRFRFGGAIYLPFGHGGIYLNAGEVFDFLVGFLRFDPAGDDAAGDAPAGDAPASPTEGS